MEHAEHANDADVPHFVFSTDPGWQVGLHFATVGISSGQMSVEVATRDTVRAVTRGKRKGRTNVQVSSGAARQQRD